ncbi:MAG TPA: hypothetical protein VN923_03225 [Thermoanaerobaculia bacterium]|nr:hypothetical protein [Thermoanaerobaculia bacterium]
MITRDIQAYMSRDWEAVRAAKDRYWAQQVRVLGPAEGLRAADELRRQVLALHPSWPSPADRSADLAAHARLAELLRRADRSRRR